jgi:hypothetical protein
MDNSSHKLIDGILTICFYNGYEEFIIDLVEYLEKQVASNNLYDSILFSEFMNGKYAWNYDNPNDENSTIHTIQMLLVNEYGDYGTSIRFGWIDGQNYKRLLDDLTYQIENQWQDQKMLEDGSFVPYGDNPFKRNSKKSIDE